MRVITLFSTILLFLFISCNNQAKEKKYRANIDTFVESYLNNKDQSKLNTIIADDYIRKMNGITVVSNIEELKASINLIFIGFPDLKITNHDLYIHENKVFVNWTFIGTNTGVFAEVPATGKKVKVSGFTVIQFSDGGKISQEDVYYNELDLLQQLGYTLTPPFVE